jgi:hypothetical protein
MDYKKLFLMVILTSLLFCIAACQTTSVKEDALSLEEANRIALQFESKYKDPPPRGFGHYIDFYVQRYLDLDTAVVICTHVKKEFTDEEIDALADSYSYNHAPAMMRQAAYVEFRKGEAIMPRTARLVVGDEQAVYHVMSRTALEGFPMGAVEKDHLLGLIKRFRSSISPK